MARRRVLFITQFLPPDRTSKQTGGTISNLNMLRAMGERHDVHVLTFDPTADPSQFTSEPFRVTQRIPPIWRAPGILLHWLPFVRRETTRLLAQEGRPDILLATTSSLAAFDAAPSSTRTAAIIQAFENFGLFCQWVPRNTRISIGKSAILHRLQDTRLLRHCDAIITNSSFMRDAISARFDAPKEKLHVAPQLVDIFPLPEPASAGTVGFVHRGPDKGLALVLQVAKLAPKLTFLIYGHASGFPSSLPENVVLKGWATDRARMFASASLWLVPSLWAEPLGRVSIEAQAANRAVLVADTGGLPETVRSRAQIVSGYDPMDWIARIHDALQTPGESLEQIGKSVRETHSSQRHTQTIDEIVSRIMES